MRQSICDRQYRGATWACWFLVVFNQLSGVNTINIFATRLLLNIESSGSGDLPFSAATGTYIIASCNAASAILAFIPVNFFGRKTILIVGHISMSIILALTGLLIIMEKNLSLFILINLFVCSF
mmetsp:Transcript_35141/g.47425  ORF Transcript_35141/g.47425 Transcript_35141/m.47425 type:complete len:124 (+) Transcript_35141:130-501(+)